MAKLIFLRHGESEWNTLGKWTGLTDVGLTEKGEEEAKNAGESLKDISLDSGFCSVLKRAKDTLTLSHASSRFYKGRRSDLQKSRFFNEAGLCQGSLRVEKNTAFKKGDLVRHKIFGTGRIIGVAKSGKESLFVEWGGLVRAIVTDVQNGIDVSIMSCRFHNSLVKIILEIADRVRQQSGINEVVLSGGVFQNMLLGHFETSWLLTTNSADLIFMLTFREDGKL